MEGTAWQEAGKQWTGALVRNRLKQILTLRKRRSGGSGCCCKLLLPALVGRCEGGIAVCNSRVQRRDVRTVAGSEVPQVLLQGLDVRFLLLQPRTSG